MATTPVKTFVVTEDHLKLLRASYVSWCDTEYGAACLDPKRPYGNSDVEDDIPRVLEEFPADAGDETSEPRYTDAQRQRFVQLHKDLEVVLQIVLRTARFEPGTYRCEGYGIDWRKVD